jgi:hypothetical protein
MTLPSMFEFDMFNSSGTIETSDIHKHCAIEYLLFATGASISVLSLLLLTMYHAVSCFMIDLHE